MCDKQTQQTQLIVESGFNNNNNNTENEDKIESDDSAWAKLLPVNSAFSSVELNRDITTFGRRSDCNVVLDRDNSVCVMTAYSNLHFRIKREFSIKTGYHALLEDLSSNGTFIDGEKIGKGKIHALKNNSEISLSKKENKAFIFIDQSQKDDKKLPPQIRNRYTITKLLGSGAYGEVKLAFEKDTCEKYAIKIISKKKFTINGRNQMSLNNQIMSEVNILKRLEHPCIIKIKEVIDTFDTVYIVLELVEGGELFDKVVSLGNYDEKTSKLIFYQMVQAIKYLHDQGISHRDLKPENILLCSSEKTETLIKVTDFGLSKFFDSTSVMKTFCGTPNYLAPEVLLTRGEGAYTNKVDNWSLGIILYICLVGYPPFSEENTLMSLENQIINGAYDFPTQYWSEISDEAIDVIKKLLCLDPNKRASLEEILQHNWIKNDPETIQKAHDLMYPDEIKKRCLHETFSQEDFNNNIKKFKLN